DAVLDVPEAQDRVFLGGEVVEERPWGDVGFGADLRDGDVVDPVFQGAAEGCPVDRFPGLPLFARSKGFAAGPCRLCLTHGGSLSLTKNCMNAILHLSNDACLQKSPSVV